VFLQILDVNKDKMFKIGFYTTVSGKQPVKEFLVSIRKKKDKDILSSVKK
jgi:hypothetical protein